MSTRTPRTWSRRSTRSSQEVQATQPPAGTIALQLYATVEDVVKVMDLERLRSLEGCHILSWDCVASRFHYRNKPGVHVMAVRVYRRSTVITVQNTPDYDGCVSWVDLDEALATEGCTPVLSDAGFGAHLADIRARLAGAGTAKRRVFGNLASGCSTDMAPIFRPPTPGRRGEFRAEV